MNSSVCRIGQSCGRSAMQKKSYREVYCMSSDIRTMKKGRSDTSTVTWLSVQDGPGWVFRKVLISLDFHTRLSRVHPAWCEKHPLSRLKHLDDDERDRRSMTRLVWVYSNSNKHSLHPWWAEKHLGTDNTRIFVGESLPWIFCPLREEIDGL